MTDRIEIDGSFGEGGGQILRTALSLSAITGRPLRVMRIRAGRSHPGLRPQHVACVRAMQMICDAEVSGAEVDSSEITFEPHSQPQAGSYRVDVSKLGGTPSAGSVMLIYQALLMPLSLASGPSELELIGGTHVAWSPCFHYVDHVYTPVLARCGIEARLDLKEWGFYPRGKGRVLARIEGQAPERTHLSGLELVDRGKLLEAWGISAAANLPEHVAQRQRAQALQGLRARHIKGEIALEAPRSAGPGTVLCLFLRYASITAGFAGYGRLRYPAERVADDAVEGMNAYLSSKAALDPYLADQVLVPFALAPTESRFTVALVTQHLLTNAWVIARFLEREIIIDGGVGQPGRVQVV